MNDWSESAAALASHRQRTWVQSDRDIVKGLARGACRVMQPVMDLRPAHLPRKSVVSTIR